MGQMDSCVRTTAVMISLVAWRLSILGHNIFRVVQLHGSRALVCYEGLLGRGVLV